MPTDKHCEPSKLKVKGFGVSSHIAIKNVAQRQGVSISRFGQKAVVAIVSSYPDEMKIKCTVIARATACEPCGDILIRGLSKRVIAELTNIAEHIGVHPSEFIKVKMAEATYALPAYMRTPLPRD